MKQINDSSIHFSIAWTDKSKCCVYSYFQNLHDKNRTWDFNQADDAILLGFDSIRFVEKMCLTALLKHSMVLKI